MEEVKKDILGWDVDSILRSKGLRDPLLKRLPTYFESLEQYCMIFWKLLVEELRAHLQQVRLIRCTYPSACIADHQHRSHRRFFFASL